MIQLSTTRALTVVTSSILTLGIAHYFWDRFRSNNMSDDSKDSDEATDEKKDEANDDKIENTTPDLSLKDIIGCSNVQEEVRRYVECLKNSDKFQNLKVSIGNGCLLVGSAGSGKRTIAHAVAGEAKVNFFEITDIIPGDGEFGYMLLCNGKKVMSVPLLFEMCRMCTPCVIFVNHIDMIMETCRGTIMVFLHEMEKKKENEGIVFFAASCENLSGLEEKLVCRFGRFNHRIKLEPPNFQERKEIFTFLLRGLKHDNTLDVDILARRTEGAEIGDIKQLLNTCVIRLLTENRSEITLADVDELIDDIKTGHGDKKFVVDKESLKATAYHEAGHTLVRYYGGEQGIAPLYKVSIVKRSEALGITFGLAEGKYRDYTKQRILQEIDVGLGGRAAEELLLGKDRITAGCGSDLEKATFYAEAMVKNLSMSEKIGLRVYRNDESGYSDELKRNIESEIDSILQESYKRVMTLLSEHKAELDLISNALLLKKTLYGDDVRELIEESLSTASGDNDLDKKKEKKNSPNIVLMRTFSKTATVKTLHEQ